MSTNDPASALLDIVRSASAASLPEDQSEIQLLRHHVSHAIAYLASWSALLKSEVKAFAMQDKFCTDGGRDSLVHIPEFEQASPPELVSTRWDVIYRYLEGSERVSLLLLLAALQEGIVRAKNRLALLPFTSVIEHIASELGTSCPPEMSREQFRERVALNFSAALEFEDNQKVLVAIDLLIHVLKHLEHRVVMKREERDFVGWKSPAEWREIYERYGESMSESTWQRRVSDGTIRVHPEGTNRRVKIHISTLPSAYVEFLGKSEVNPS